MWTNRRTDMTKLIVAFRNFANASKNETRFNSKVLATIERFTLWSSQHCSNVNMKLDLIVILPVLLHGDEISSAILKKKQALTLRGLTCSQRY
jgi:hypothetical protein